MKVQKAIVPIAGFGTRMLPATKSVPKEMLTIIDKPVIHYVLDELVESGIKNITLVNNPTKIATEEYFKPNSHLGMLMKESGRYDLLEQIHRITDLASISFIYLESPSAVHSILAARDVVGDEPFAIVHGDDIFDSTEPRFKQLIDTYEVHQKSVLTLLQSNDDHFHEYCSQYACVGASEVEGNTYRISSIIEKPGPAEAPSNLFSISGYVFTPNIFRYLKKAALKETGEIMLPEAIAGLIEHDDVYGRVVDGTFLDVGNKMGLLQANAYFALKREDTRDAFRHYVGGLLDA